MPALAHPGKLSLFAALSLADLGLTHFLLESPGRAAYEWNPVASWCLVRFGWAGLAAFKLATVLTAVGLVLAVSRRRPRAAERLLSFGCVALMVVIAYSGLLVPTVQADADDAERIDAQTQTLERQLDRDRARVSVIYHLTVDLTSRRRTLAEATEILAASDAIHDPAWQRNTAVRFASYNGKAVLAALLIEEVVLLSANGPSGTALLYRDLSAEFRSRFGRPGPPPPLPLDETASGPS